MTHLPQKNVNSIQFEKGIDQVNHALSLPRFTNFEGKMSGGLFFFSRFQTHRETSELQNSSKRPRKFPEIFGNSQIILGNSGTWQDKKLMPLAQKKLAGIPDEARQLSPPPASQMRQLCNPHAKKITDGRIAVFFHKIFILPP